MKNAILGTAAVLWLVISGLLLTAKEPMSNQDALMLTTAWSLDYNERNHGPRSPDLDWAGDTPPEEIRKRAAEIRASRKPYPYRVPLFFLFTIVWGGLVGAGVYAVRSMAGDEDLDGQIRAGRPGTRS